MSRVRNVADTAPGPPRTLRLSTEALAIPPAPSRPVGPRPRATLALFFRCFLVVRIVRSQPPRARYLLFLPSPSSPPKQAEKVARSTFTSSGHNDRYVYRSLRRAFMSFVFQWPRRPLVRRIGFPPPRPRSLICRRSLFTPVSRSSNRAATAFAVKCLLQRLCHVPSNPDATVVATAMHAVWASFASRVDSNSTRIGASAGAPRHEVAGRLLAGQPARPACGRALRRIPVNYADASEPYRVIAAPAQCVASVRRGKSRTTVMFHICRKTS